MDTKPTYDPCRREWDLYLEASRELAAATEAVKPLIAVMHVEPGAEVQEIRNDGMAAFRRLSKAKEAEFDKYKAWVDCRMAHGL